MIYADYAATAPMRPAAVKVMTAMLEEVYGNPSSLHGPGQAASAALSSARRTIAECLGAAPSELYMNSGGSESDNQALRSAALAGAAKGKRHIISTVIEHHAVLNTLEKLRQEGFSVELLQPDEDGIVTADQVKRAIRPDTALVSVMYANNEIGTILPVREIGAVCREASVLFHSDAVQAAGHLPIRVGEDCVDYLSVSAHKFGGPKGVGALYVRKGAPLASLIEGGAQERGKRAGTENVPGIAAMAAALRESCDRMEEENGRVMALRDALTDGLLRIPGTRLNGSRTRRLPGNVNICFEGLEGESLLLLLDSRGIAASSGSACASGSLDPSHVLTAIGLSKTLARGSLRFSLGPGNTAEEIREIVSAAAWAASRLRSMMRP